jgi:hypothetical protein
MASRAQNRQTMRPLDAQITIRPAYADDDDALHRLAVLDSASGPPPRPLLVAEVNGELRAAVALADASAIADPFYPSAELVALLRAHRAAAGVSPRARRRPRRLQPGLARG